MTCQKNHSYQKINKLSRTTDVMIPKTQQSQKKIGLTYKRAEVSTDEWSDNNTYPD